MALVEIGDPTAISALSEAIKNENIFVRWRAADALGKINTSEAQKALEEYNKQKSKKNL